MKRAHVFKTLLPVFIGCCTRNRIHVCLCSVAGVWTWALLIGSPLLPIDLLIVPLLLFGIYQWNRIYDWQEDHINTPKSAVFAYNNRTKIAVISIFCIVIGFCIGFLIGNSAAILLLAVVVILGYLYSTPVGRFRRLKSLFIAKNVTSAFGWALVVVLYPVVHAGGSVSDVHVLAFWLMFLVVWMVELVWDIRDMNGDRINGIKTIPIVFGIERAQLLILTLNTFSALIIIFGIIFELIPIFWLLILVNQVLIFFWVSPSEHFLLKGRKWSHLFIVLQTILLALIGLGKVYLD